MTKIVLLIYIIRKYIIVVSRLPNRTEFKMSSRNPNVFNSSMLFRVKFDRTELRTVLLHLNHFYEFGSIFKKSSKISQFVCMSFEFYAYFIKVLDSKLKPKVTQTEFQILLKISVLFEKNIYLRMTFIKYLL